MALLHDMHCHLDFMEDGEEVAGEACAFQTMLFANTVTPAGWRAACERFARFENVRVGFGMHPWWASGEKDVEAAAGGRRQQASQRAERRRLAACAREQPHASAAFVRERCEELLADLRAGNPAFIGEVGLDFGWRHLHTRPLQEALLACVASWAVQSGGKLISLHSIQAARETLDILEAAGALGSCTCVFHWFSGPSDQLKRAIEAGCYFSCGARMLASGKGREYVKAIPPERLLLETDAPPAEGARYSYDELRESLEAAAEAISAIKGERVLETIAATSARLLVV